MSRYFEGSEGFAYRYITVRRDLPIEDLARISGVGLGRLVVDNYQIFFEEGESEMIYLEALEDELDDLEEDEERGFYEPDSQKTTMEELTQQLLKNERKTIGRALREHFSDRRPTQIEVTAYVQYLLMQDDWEEMLAYLNRHLPDEAQLTMEDVRSFRSDVLAGFDPEQHEARREDGTGFLKHFLETGEDDCLPYLGLRVLVHAVENDLERMDLEDEPRWGGVLWSAPPKKSKR